MTRTLNTTALNRRQLLQGVAGLTFVLGAGGVREVVASTQTDALDVNPWLTIRADGGISIVFPSTEMGQSSYSTLPQILAEELDANWDDVEILQLNQDDRTFGNPLFGGVLYTAGSTAVQAYFEPMRQAGAQARAVLLQIAARAWGVSPSDLRTEPSVVVALDGRRMSYGELAGRGAEGVTVPDAATVPLKASADFRIIGHDVPRRDVIAKSTGRAQYAIDVDLPDMLHASVARAPAEGEVPLSVDDSDARSVPGVVEIVTLPDGVAVVADSLWAALNARFSLDIQWSETAAARSFNSADTLDAYAAAAEDPQAEAAVWATKGDA